MEHIEKIKESIQAIKSVMSLPAEENSERYFILNKLKVIEEEITEFTSVRIKSQKR